MDHNAENGDYMICLLESREFVYLSDIDKRIANFVVDKISQLTDRFTLVRDPISTLGDCNEFISRIDEEEILKVNDPCARFWISNVDLMIDSLQYRVKVSHSMIESLCSVQRFMEDNEYSIAHRIAKCFKESDPFME